MLLLVHGLAEHSGRHLNPVRHFVARGWACFGFDYRGHGKSPGPRVHVNSFDEFLADLAEAHRLVEAPLMTIPALVMQAVDDRPVDPDTTRTWVASAPADLVEYVEWSGYYHELFNEPMLERRKVFDKMEQWLESHSG